MKKILSLLTIPIIFVVISCNEQSQCVDKDEELAKIESVLEKYVMANENQDFSLIEQIWAPDENIILIGTDNDETYVGWKQIKKAIQHQFNEFEDTYIAVLDQKVNLNKTGNTAWFSEVLNYNFIYHGEAMSFEGIRFTGIIEKRDENWLLVQVHLSIPVPEGTETQAVD